MDAKEITTGTWEEFKLQVLKDYEQSREALHEVSLMVEQSKAEYDKLTQRSANATTQLQQLQDQIETAPREDIQSIYNNALDAQQRLLVMRGQVEKLQNDQTAYSRHLKLLEKTKQLLEEGYQPENPPASPVERTGMLEQLINAQEAERQRLSRQMHDGPAQALSNFIVQAEIAARLLEIDPARAKSELENLKTTAMGTFQRVRLFITELRPMMLDDLGLAATIKRYVETFKDETGFDSKVEIKGGDKKLAPYIEVMIFRAIQELMGNVVRNNSDLSVKPNIQVNMAIEDNFVRVTVADNGKGFAVNNLENKPTLGLKLIRDRVEMLGGTFEIDSSPGQGARITFQIPVDSASGL